MYASRGGRLPSLVCCRRSSPSCGTILSRRRSVWTRLSRSRYIWRKRIHSRAPYVGLIRARRGTSSDVVAAAVGAVGRAIDERDFSSRGLKLYPVGLKADVISRIRPALVVLGAAGLVLVFMLMVNLASVLLARAAQ